MPFVFYKFLQQTYSILEYFRYILKILTGNYLNFTKFSGNVQNFKLNIQWHLRKIFDKRYPMLEHLPHILKKFYWKFY